MCGRRTENEDHPVRIMLFILSAVALLESLQATSDSSRSEFLICDVAIEHQNSCADFAPFNFMKS